LGDAVERALAAVGVTPERVERWIGKPCGCRERKAKLNRLGQWLARRLAGRPGGKAELEDVMGEG